MKGASMIFFFTGTGNSRAAAEALGKELGEKVADITEAIRRREFTHHISEGEKLGFVFPAYFYGAPTIVDEFVHHIRLEGTKDPYAFCVITCGERIAAADRQFAKMLRRRGIPLSYTYPLVMPNNSVLWYELPTPEQQVKGLADADADMIKIAAAIRNGEVGGYSSGLGSRLKTSFMQSLYKHGRKTAKFHAEETCIGCGLCARNCPIAAIRIDEKRPRWVAERCVLCLACINRCPVTAIQYGNATKNRRRYVNPILRKGQ
jgi:ferredoxin/flavodoxin